MLSQKLRLNVGQKVTVTVFNFRFGSLQTIIKNLIGWLTDHLYHMTENINLPAKSDLIFRKRSLKLLCCQRSSKSYMHFCSKL